MATVDYVAIETPHHKLSNPLEVAVNMTQEEASEEPNTKQDVAADGKAVPLLQLFSYADSMDQMLMTLGTIGAIGAGILQPLQIVLFGDVMNAFNPLTPSSPGEIQHAVSRVALRFVYLAIAALVCGLAQNACWTVTASRQSRRIRSAYVSAILSKEIAWFELNDPMQLPTRVAESATAMQNGMGRKIGDSIHLVSMALAGIIIGFIKGWQLTLVLIALTPFMAGAGYVSMQVMTKANQSVIAAYAQAGAIAQESLSNIRTVHMFNSISHFTNKYEQALGVSTLAGTKKGFAIGWGTGLMFFAIFCTYACGLYFGAYKIANDQLDGSTCTGSDCYDGGRVLTVFFSVTMGATALGQAGPALEGISSARSAAFDVFAVIQRKSLIDPLSNSGRVLSKVLGHITIDQVSFAYPSRPDIQVCSDYSLTIHPGETIALVGPSGSGKSTIVSLLERFYDPSHGSVFLDGHDIKDLNVKWLRGRIGLVGQEPTLFSTSIRENIRHGKTGATDKEVFQAAKMANAFDFIMEFPNGFDTEVGEHGVQLSGGQKQRIAITRAIIKNPPILLLDEATSALDSESEHIVQTSLDRLLSASERTTIIIAHRLSTIRNASRIAVHSGGSIVEIGTHDELMRIKNGHYRLLVEAQSETNETTSIHWSGQSLLDKAMVELTRELNKIGTDANQVETSASDSSADADVSTGRIWKMSLPEWKFMALGSVGALVNAATFPVWGVLLAKITVLFFQYDKTKHEMMMDAGYWSLGFVGLGVVFGLSIITQHYSFAVASQRLTTRVRLATYSAILHQEVGWFDLDANSSGALVSRLASDSATLQAMTSETLNQTLVSLCSVGIALAIAFYHNWQMTLALLATSPVLMLIEFVRAQQMTGNIDGKTSNDADASAGSLLSEAIGSVRTVASLGMESAVTTEYAGFLDISKRLDMRTGLIGGLTFGLSMAFNLLLEAFLFWLGGKWTANGTITFSDFFVVLLVVILSMFGVAMASQNATDNAKAKLAAKRVFNIIDRVPKIDTTITTGHTPERLNGEIEFKNLVFAYPSRPETNVYDNYSLKIPRGHTVALVGASGSGKSTAISLLERFYDPAAGNITLDGVDIRQLSLPWLREHISLVSQEPVLFSGTIADNIAFGKPGASREEVIDAAKKANAFEFISNFPNGFDTDVGDRGAQVSGGQKQRIAIARAILRDPEVLLLDEATSALDNESERVVQASLDRLMALKQRTTIIVAHRLSTIRNADIIAVMQDGGIVEQGAHDTLMNIPNGVYRSLVSRQMGAH